MGPGPSESDASRTCEGLTPLDGDQACLSPRTQGYKYRSVQLVQIIIPLAGYRYVHVLTHYCQLEAIFQLQSYLVVAHFVGRSKARLGHYIPYSLLHVQSKQYSDTDWWILPTYECSVSGQGGTLWVTQY